MNGEGGNNCGYLVTSKLWKEPPRGRDMGNLKRLILGFLDCPT